MNLAIIAPHFPPSSLPPSQRVRLLVKNLKSLDVTTTIFTTNSKFREESIDDWMLELAGDDYNLIEVKSFNPVKTRKLGIGDLGLRMLPFLLPKLLAHSLTKKPDFLLYLVPPWYILLIAPFVKFLSGVPYAIDFIDPWVAGGEISKKASFKKKTSQWIARNLEGFVTKNASIIYAVSEGINQQLVERHPTLKRKEMYAIPYGAEQSDFFNQSFTLTESDTLTIRYIGAVWEDAYLTLDSLFTAISEIKTSFKCEFYGTSYAGEGLAKPQLDKWINKLSLIDRLIEFPDRVTYKKAVELNMKSDILLLFGGMQPYYAASKLFGLIVSEKPFFAFLHRDSYPAKFLTSMNYKYLVTYSETEGDLPVNQKDKVKDVLSALMAEFVTFEPLNINDSRILEHTALGMTKAFVKPMFQKLKNEKIPR
tara:strand:- start:2886 stop:4151 length:1266 start_codon:yes stop_codon:yes gene_type:complete